MIIVVVPFRTAVLVLGGDVNLHNRRSRMSHTGMWPTEYPYDGVRASPYEQNNTDVNIYSLLYPGTCDYRTSS